MEYAKSNFLFSAFNHMLQNHIVEIERQFVEKMIYDTWLTSMIFSNISTHYSEWMQKLFRIL